MIYDWKIISLVKKTVEGTPEVVTEVVWEKTGYSDEGYKGSYKLTTRFEYIRDKDFIEYKDLKKKDIIHWIEMVIDQNNVNNAILVDMERSKCNEVRVLDGNYPWEV